MNEFELTDLLIGMPDGIANMQLPDPCLRDYYRDEANRIFWVTDQICTATLDLVKLIIKSNIEDSGKPVEDRKRVLVMIDSIGGDVDVEQSIIGAIKTSKTPVHTCCYCKAYSAAGDLLACGHKRYALKYTNIMFHAGSGRYEGTQAQIDSAKRFFDSVNQRINDEVYSRVKFDKKIIKRLKTDDVFMNEEEALKYGVIDKIVDNFEELM